MLKYEILNLIYTYKYYDSTCHNKNNNQSQLARLIHQRIKEVKRDKIYIKVVRSQKVYFCV